MFRSHVLICGGTGCTSSGSQALFTKLEGELQAKGLENEIKIVQTGCFGLCANGPIVIVYPEGAFYSQATAEGAVRIVKEHIIGGEPCKDLLFPETVQAAYEEAGITPVDQPRDFDVKTMSKEEGVVMAFNVTVKPEITLKAYKGLTAEKADSKVTKDIKNIKKRQVTYMTLFVTSS